MWREQLSRAGRVWQPGWGTDGLGQARLGQLHKDMETVLRAIGRTRGFWAWWHHQISASERWPQVGEQIRDDRLAQGRQWLGWEQARKKWMNWEARIYRSWWLVGWWGRQMKGTLRFFRFWLWFRQRAKVGVLTKLMRSLQSRTGYKTGKVG